jgi:hypothetical protein
MAQQRRYNKAAGQEACRRRSGGLRLNVTEEKRNGGDNTRAASGRRAAMLVVLSTPRPPWLLLAIALAIGVAWTLPMLPLRFITGSGDFWAFPSAAFGATGNGNDAAQVEAGYLALTQTP